jgi:ABC-2 type transport system ATP-binding protein
VSNKLAIQACNLTKKFGDLVAVNNITFEIHEGEIVGILGPNGAGKTTTIRLITGVFQLEDKSTVMIYSQDFTSSKKELKKLFGIVPEVSNAYSDFTVWQNLSFSGRIYGLSKAEIRERVNDLLERFELIDKLHAKTKTLSKGLKQRLNLCLALLHEPSVLILDEPTSGLDPFSVNIVRKQILQFRDEGKTILITTHNMQEAQQICDRILIMNRGNIIADENPDTLRKNFKQSSTILFQSENKLSNELKDKLKAEFVLKEEKNGYFQLVSRDPLEDISKLNSFLKSNNVKLKDFKLLETTLEEVFIHLIEKDHKPNEGLKNDD